MISISPHLLWLLLRSMNHSSSTARDSHELSEQVQRRLDSAASRAADHADQLRQRKSIILEEKKRRSEELKQQQQVDAEKKAQQRKERVDAHQQRMTRLQTEKEIVALETTAESNGYTSHHSDLMIIIFANISVDGCTIDVSMRTSERHYWHD
jgi:arginine utilization protein RocB